MKKILFITNGHGEDIVAAQIIKTLDLNALAINAMPVVGPGTAFKGLKVQLIGPKKILPGGGFGLRNFSYLIKDIFSGLIGKVIAQIKVLRKNRHKYDLVIGIGDIVPILYSILTGCDFIFVGVNKSAYYKRLAFNYTGFEKWLLKKYCKLTLARDQKTASELVASGIKAKYVGNPMMDTVVKGTGAKRSAVRRSNIIGFLPGTREDAYKNIEDFYKIVWQINRLDKRIDFVLSFPETLDKKRLGKMPSKVPVMICSDFKKVLESSTIIIGLSGTGNEQAAGVGLPVIAFPGRGAQFNFKFAKGQKELLGNSLLLLPRDSQMIANSAITLIYNKRGIASMAHEGRKRMGRPGASRKIAKIVQKEIGI